MLAHHRHRWARTLCIDERAITRDLTAPLRMDLALFVHRAAFERVKVFAALPRSTARRLAAVASTQACPARESVYAAGDVGWDVYFIFHGSVKLVPPADASVLDAAGRDVYGRLRAERDEASGAAAARLSLIHI